MFTLFWASLRQLFKAGEMSEAIDEYLIDIYRDFNAPFPEELITKVVN